MSSKPGAEKSEPRTAVDRETGIAATGSVNVEHATRLAYDVESGASAGVFQHASEGTGSRVSAVAVARDTLVTAGRLWQGGSATNSLTFGYEDPCGVRGT